MLHIALQRPLALVAAATLLLALVGCDGPVLIIPGGRLAGPEVAPPPAWGTFEDTIQLETRPDEPYSVNIWAVSADGALYVATGADGTRWTAHIAANPAVRVRIGGSVTALVARPVTDAGERARVVAAYQLKYDVDADDNFIRNGLAFRLDAR